MTLMSQGPISQTGTLALIFFHYSLVPLLCWRKTVPLKFLNPFSCPKCCLPAWTFIFNPRLYFYSFERSLNLFFTQCLIPGKSKHRICLFFVKQNIWACIHAHEIQGFQIHGPKAISFILVFLKICWADVSNFSPLDLSILEVFSNLNESMNISSGLKISPSFKGYISWAGHPSFLLYSTLTLWLLIPKLSG